MHIDIHVYYHLNRSGHQRCREMERDHRPVDHNHSPTPALRDVEVVEVVGEMEEAGGDDSGSGERHTHTSYRRRSGHSIYTPCMDFCISTYPQAFHVFAESSEAGLQTRSIGFDVRVGDVCQALDVVESGKNGYTALVVQD